jgi:hypothetical protein
VLWRVSIRRHSVSNPNVVENITQHLVIARSIVHQSILPTSAEHFCGSPTSGHRQFFHKLLSLVHSDGAITVLKEVAISLPSHLSCSPVSQDVRRETAASTITTRSSLLEVAGQAANSDYDSVHSLVACLLSLVSCLLPLASCLLPLVQFAGQGPREGCAFKMRGAELAAKNTLMFSV